VEGFIADKGITDSKGVAGIVNVSGISTWENNQWREMETY
jgi:hypothetical protein